MIISMHSRKIEVNRFNHQLHWMHKNFLFFLLFWILLQDEGYSLMQQTNKQQSLKRITARFRRITM